MKLLKTGIRPIDGHLGGVQEKSLILLHETDARSLGKLLAFELLEYEDAFKEGRFFIIDTFGSIYDHRVDHKNIQYLGKPISIETLNSKYIEVIREHKQTWAEGGMFEGRELWGITLSVSDYNWMFGEEPTLRYHEFIDAQRHTSDVYREYPSGTNL